MWLLFMSQLILESKFLDICKIGSGAIKCHFLRNIVKLRNCVYPDDKFILPPHKSCVRKNLKMVLSGKSYTYVGNLAKQYPSHTKSHPEVPIDIFINCIILKLYVRTRTYGSKVATTINIFQIFPDTGFLWRQVELTVLCTYFLRKFSGIRTSFLPCISTTPY